MEWVTLFYFLLVNSFYGVVLLAAACEMRQHALETRGTNHWRLMGSKVAPSITMLAPAYNEALTIRDSVQALLTLYYPNLEVVVVNDGSKDRTLTELVDYFEMVPIHPIHEHRIETSPVIGLYRSQRYPNLLVVDKANGGKADALNAGLNFATGKLVCAIDADTLIEPDSLQRMVRPFLAEDHVVAVGGTIRVVNGCLVRGGRVIVTRVPRKPLAGFQAVEYLRAFLFGRLGFNRLGGNLIISGAFGIFNRESVLEAGGYDQNSVTEDMELILRLRRHSYEEKRPHKVIFIPDPVAWTEVPESLKMLGRQRDRWHRGLADVMWRSRHMLLNPRYGKVGLLGYPYFLFVELLSPVVEMLGLAGIIIGFSIGAIDLRFAMLFFLVAYGYGLVLTAFTLVLDEVVYHRYETIRDRILLLLWMLQENFGYRQLTVLWRLRGLLKFMQGRRDWGAMNRRGFSVSAATVDSYDMSLPS